MLDQTDYDSIYDDLDDHKRAYNNTLDAFSSDWAEIERLVNQVMYRIENDCCPTFDGFIAGDDFPNKKELIKYVIRQLVKEVDSE